MDQTCTVLKLKLGSFIVNYSYIIIDRASKEAAIVDPAWELGKVTTTLDGLGVRLTQILLTHSHIDHVNLVSPLVELYNPMVFMSAKEIDFYGFRCKNLNPVCHLDSIKLGHTLIECLFTPGHTAGGMCFVLPDSIFTGDTIFIEGCGICNTQGGSPEKMFESIQMVKNMVHPNTLVYPGHSYGKEPGCSLSLLMDENIYFLIEKRGIFVNFRMRKNQKYLKSFQP